MLKHLPGRHNQSSRSNSTITKHLSGRHNQQKHAGQLYTDSIFKILKYTPVDPKLGAPTVTVTDTNIAQITFEHSVAIIQASLDTQPHLNAFANTEDNDKYRDVIEFGRGLCRQLGYDVIQMSITSPEQLPVLVDNNYRIDLGKINKIVELEDADVDVNVKSRFTNHVIRALKQQGKTYETGKILHRLNAYIDADANLPDWPRMRDLNLFGSFKVLQVLKEGYPVYGIAESL